MRWLNKNKHVVVVAVKVLLWLTAANWCTVTPLSTDCTHPSVSPLQGESSIASVGCHTTKCGVVKENATISRLWKGSTIHCC